MKNYTVRVHGLTALSTKVYKRVKAKNEFDAMEQVRKRGRHGNCSMEAILSRNDGGAWTRGRERHEGREQNRSYWAVVAKRGGRQNLAQIKADPILYYLRTMERFNHSWRDPHAATLTYNPGQLTIKAVEEKRPREESK